MILGAIAAKLGAGAIARKVPLEDAPVPAPQVAPPQQKQRPNEAIFNTQFTTAGKRFLTKIKKNRAMQVDRRTRGFQLGLEQRKVVVDPFTSGHYGVMIVDPDMQRRENLADDLEQRFEIFVAPSNERAFALLALFQVNFVLLRLDIGNDQTAATSPALAFLREMKRTCFRTPVAALVDSSFTTDHEAQKLLARALQQGGICGYFEEGLAPDLLAERIAKLLRSLSVAQNELGRCRGGQPSVEAASRAQSQASPVHKQPQQPKVDNQVVARMTPPSSATGRKRLPPTEVPNTRPSSVSFDRPAMLLELTLNQRKQCLRQQEALQATLASAPHSVLGVEIESSPMSPTSPSPAFGSPGRMTNVKKKIPPLPSPKQVSRLIYTKPQELQTRIGRHLYERLHIAGPPGAVPQDPLLNHCVVIDPRAQGRDVVVGKAYMLYCEQRLDEALLHCDRALRTPNATLEKLARLLRGALYDARGEHTRAETDFLACLQLDPAMHEAHFNLSVARLKLGKDALALQALTQALTLDPQNDKYLHNRGLMYRRMGQFVQAQSEYSKREIVSGAAAPSPGLRSAKSTISTGVGKRLTTRGKLSKCEMEDGLFAHLFGKPTPDKLALACPAAERSVDMLSAIVARLQTLLFFQDFPREILNQVAQAVDYDVVACGKSFVLGETHSQNFYVLLGGRLSIRRRMGTTDLGLIVTTHHLGTGSVFGCAGFTVSAQASLIADESAEIGILWPDSYAATIRSVTSQTNQDVFAFLQQLRGFRRLTTSELGHVVGISERKRFRKGDVLLEQNEQPRHLIVLWKGSCSIYQDFDSAPLSRRKLRRSADFDGLKDEEDDEDTSDDSGDSEADDGSDGEDNPEAAADKRKWRRHGGEDEEETGAPPFHRLIAKPDWPLGFQARTRARKYRRGRRAGLLLMQTPLVVQSKAPSPPETLSLPMRRLRDKLSANNKNALVQKCVAPAVFGESRFLNPTHAPSKCCVVAESLVEVLLFDHMRLQEMDLQPEVISELFDAAPKYLSEKQVAQKQADVATWDEYRNLRVLELSKKRWPEAKASFYLQTILTDTCSFTNCDLAFVQRNLRALSNGCSIILADSSTALQPSSKQDAPTM